MKVILREEVENLGDLGDLVEVANGYGRNYLIPVEADINREKDVIVEAVDIDTVLKAIDLAGNNLNFVILDACRNNPYARSFRSASRGLARMQSPIHNA